MKWKILFWVVLFVVQSAIITIFLSESFIENEQRKEFSAVRYILGPAKEAQVNAKAKETYYDLFVKSGFVRSYYRHFTTSDRKRAKSTGLENLGKNFVPWAERRFRIFLKVMYGAIYRVYYILYIIPFILAALLAGIIDGLVNRQIKKAEYKYANPTYYHAAKNAMWITAVSPIFFAFLPLGVNPYLFVSWFVILPIVLWIGVSNVQHFAED